MKTFFLVWASVCLCIVNGYAQKQGNMWYFGSGAAISFQSGTPAPVSGNAMMPSEGCASIAGADGNLLFYTDGITIFNRNNTPMQNGTGLLGESWSAQSAIIVQQPLSNSIYYVFTISDWTNTNANAGLNYSIVNMSLDGGRGAVTSKNMPVNSNVREQVTSIIHGNCQDVWIVTHEKGNDQFKAYLLTNAGLNTTPVTSALGGNYLGSNRYGYLKASQDGRYICSTLGGSTVLPTVEYFNFDNLTGQLSNPVTLADNNSVYEAYCSEFSPDNSKLYVVSYNRSHIYQYDLNAGTPAAVAASRVNVASGNNTRPCLQLGPDRKIYISNYRRWYLGAIDEPNEKGALCKFVDRALDLTPGAECRLGLPNFTPHIFAYPNLGPDTVLCTGETISFDVSDLAISSAIWQDGSSQYSFTASQPGNYWVEVMSNSGCRMRDSVDILYIAKPVVDLGPDSTLCAGATLVLDASGATGDTYTWQDGSGATSYMVQHAGEYWVTVSNKSCSVSDTLDISFIPLPQVQLGNDTTLCDIATLYLDVSPAAGDSYTWQDGATGNDYTVTQAGEYRVMVTKDGCSASDTVMVSYAASPDPDLGNDTTLCTGATLVLDVATAAADSYTWHDGSTGATFSVSQPGQYWVEAGKGVCYTADTIAVQYSAPPQLDLGNDTMVCNGARFLLYITDPAATSFTWHDGSAYPLYLVDKQGLYWVEVSNDYGCRSRDSVTVTYTMLDAGLGNDTTLCTDAVLVLTPSTSGDGYTWQDGATDPSYTVSQPGEYWVDVSKNGCKASDTIQVSYVSLENLYLGNDTTLCNNATLTLDAALGGATGYEWQDGAGNGSYTVSQPGTYWVHVTGNGCHRYDTIQVAYATPPVVELGRDTVLCEGASLLLDASVNLPASWLWQDGSDLHTFKVVKPGKYKVSITTSCEVVSDSVLVQFENCACRVVVPNAFSPNFNGRNDLFRPVSAAGCGFAEFRFTIFNRWGEKIFDTGDPAAGWNGSYKGYAAATGAYAWMLRYRLQNSDTTHKKSGMVMLVR